VTTAVYAPPRADLTPDSEAARARLRLIRHEVSLRSLGSLYLVGGALCALPFFAMALLLAFSGSVHPGWTLGMGGIGALFAFQARTGLALRRLEARARPVVAVFSVVGLLGFPVGTILNLYALHLLYSRRGNQVFSREYQGIIEATPHVHYAGSGVRSSLLAFLLALLVGLAGGAILLAQ